MSRRFALILTLLIAIESVPRSTRGWDEVGTPRLGDVILLENCEVEFEESTPVGAGGGAAVGNLLFQESYVKLGQRVKAKQVLGQMADGELKAEYATNKVRADSDIAIRLNEAEVKEAILKLKRVERLGQRDQRFVSAEEDVRLQVDAEVAKIRLEMAKHDRVVSKLRVQELEAQLNARRIIAPHDGVVVEFYKKPGQPVISSDPVLHLVNLDLLRIIGHPNVDVYGRVAVGQKVVIRPELDSLVGAANDPCWALEGVVSFIDRRIDPKSRTGVIHAIVKNENQMLPAGIEVRMEVFAGQVKSAINTKSGGMSPSTLVSSSPNSPTSPPRALAR